MKVLITGGGGFLGGQLAQALLRRGSLADDTGIQREISQITLLDLNFPAGMDLRCTYVTSDLTDQSLVSALVGPDTTSVFHLASVVSGGAEADFDLGMRVNLDGTRALMEACRNNSHCPRFIFASSVAVFGHEFPAVVKDNSAALPLNSYGAQKVCCEYLVNDYSRRKFLDGRVLRLPTISVRPGKPNLAKSSFVSGIVREPLKGVVSRCPVSPETAIWILSPRKAIEALLRAHDLSRSAWGENRVVNLVGTTATAAEIVNTLRKIAGDQTASLVEWAPDADIQAFIDSLPVRFDAKRALAMGFVADIDIEAIIRQYISDHGIDVQPHVVKEYGQNYSANEWR